jgi:hypothetical protein
MQIDVREQRRDDAALRRTGHRRAPLALLHHACREPLPQQLQHPAIRDPQCHELEQLDVIDAAKVVTDIRVQHVVTAARPADAQRLQCLRGTALRPKPVRRGAEVGLEDRFQHEGGRHLRDPIPYRWNTQRPLPAIALGDVSPQDRLRPIRACAQRDVELVEHGLHAVLRDRRERFTIHARRAAVLLHPPPCLLKDVTPPDPIH